eukprot:gnl/TRDRNA2_/TRDRNA2_199156_c0_seq1.p1 gnl/TRDRNA2_/TRDRNA2_199156_c0~~gnl/TRDRNA2_/TRDRNA2_199156_c0_seq1.p1  ORF type:complete len:354 (-),score=32.89 gnl/TRDRNA2_/TRDRNA2_199156_c0_seq1:193-1254(-)
MGSTIAAGAQAGTTCPGNAPVHPPEHAEKGRGAALWITASLLSGRSASVFARGSDTVSNLCDAVEVALGVPVHRQLLLLGGELLGQVGGKHKRSTLEEVGLYDGARLDVVCVAGTLPLPLPSHFRAVLTPSRGTPCRCSSGSIYEYSVLVDLPCSRLAVDVVGKYDRDVIEIDTSAGLLRGKRSHWYCGSNRFETKCLVRGKLGELLERWLERSIPALDRSDKLWQWPPPKRMAGSAGTVPPTPQGVRSTFPHLDEDGNAAHGGQSSRSPTLGAFVAPSADCTELIVNVPLPGRYGLAECSLARVLLDADGRPVRAGLRGTASDEDIEEWDVELSPCSAEECNRKFSLPRRPL